MIAYFVQKVVEYYVYQVNSLTERLFRMGLVISCILLMLTSPVFALGVSFFLKNRGTTGNTRYYILALCVTASIWCAAYGSIGITDKLQRAEVLRVFGVLAINAFLVVEVFLFTGLSAMKRLISHTLRAIVVCVGFADFILYSDRKADLFVRIGNWTTWLQNPEKELARLFHSGFILLYFLILFGTGIVWIRKNKLRRQKRFILLVFLSNFLMIFFTLPDTFLPMLGFYPVATSGIGAALCAIVTWLGATRLNSFSIQLGNITEIFYESINAGAVVFDTRERIVICNPYAVRYASSDTLEGCGIEDLFEVENPKELFKHAMEDRYSITLNGKKDERVYAVNLNAAKDNFGDPYCFLCVFTDVTNEAKAIRELEIANNAKTDFLTSISHDIRTPIHSIIALSDMIIRDSTEEEIVDYAGNAKRASRHLLAIVNDLLDMGQITSGKMRIVTEEYDLGLLLRDLKDLHLVRAEEKKLQFRIYADEAMPRVLRGDNVRILQVITNLVTNAIKYTNEGSVRVDVGYRQKEEQTILLIVTVTDTGVGIREENIRHLYDTFSRFDRKAHKYIEGTGIGLAVTKSLVDMMEGTISVESTYGKGSVFTVSIPQEVVGKETVGNPDDYAVKETEAAKIGYSAPGAALLIVDDNEMNRMVFRGLVRPLQAALDEAGSGKEMLELIHKKKYDIIFLDHMMPELDGVETLKRMKEDPAHPNVDTPVIAMTANAGRDAKKRYTEYGFSDYLGKPAGAKKVYRIIKAHLPESRIVYKEVEEADEGQPVLPEIAGVDYSAARANVSDDAALTEVMKKFCSLAPIELTELNGFFEGAASGDEEALAEYRIKVHSMKNSAALVGAVGTAALAKKLEEASDQKDAYSIKAGHDEFCREYEELAERIGSAVLGEGDRENKVMDSKTLAENLNALERAMTELDMAKVNDIVYNMSGMEYETPALSEKMEGLFAAVRDYDTDQFEILVKEIRLLL